MPCRARRPRQRAPRPECPTDAATQEGWRNAMLKNCLLAHAYAISKASSYRALLGAAEELGMAELLAMWWTLRSRGAGNGRLPVSQPPRHFVRLSKHENIISAPVIRLPAVFL
jgi:hypothetical protein